MTAPDQGWHFVHPDLDVGEASADGPGLRLAPGGGVQVTRGAALVRQALLLLISTRPGERVMRPGYGCHLPQLMFAPNDDTTAGLAIHYVRQAIERWEPRAQILYLDASRDPDAAQVLRVTLRYRVRATLHEDELQLRLNLAGGT